MSETIYFTLLQTATTSLGTTKCRLISSEMVSMQSLLKHELIYFSALESSSGIDVSGYWDANQMLE